MNTTTTPRARAGKPYVPPMTLHRGIVAPPSPTKREPNLQIDFVLPDEDEQAVRSGFDQAMKAPIKPIVPQPLRDSEREPEGVDWFGYLLIACLLCVIFSGLGYLAGRYFS